jgi:hypothetical protein
MGFAALPVDTIRRHSGAGRRPEPEIQHLLACSILDSGFALTRAAE